MGLGFRVLVLKPLIKEVKLVNKNRQDYHFYVSEIKLPNFQTIYWAIWVNTTPQWIIIRGFFFFLGGGGGANFGF
jgi:hypothetical protein